MKKASIYNPYLDTLGGGERYTMAVATILSKNDFDVDIQWPDSSIKQKLENRFGINLKNINFIKDIKRGDGYDVCFWVSDGSIPTLHSRKNILHFQIPFTKVKGKTLLNKMKLIRIYKVICNSQFTKNMVDKEYGFSDKSVVLYPPVDTKKFRSKKKKENIILYVGRFSQLTQNKRQDILIEVFKKFFLKDSTKQNKNWKLILAGGSEVGADKFLLKLKQKSKFFPIEIIESPNFETLKNLYGKSSIFWSASGFEVDEQKEPSKVEHFGISLVEAMSASCVPFAFSAGGHKEIVENKVDGFLWKTKKGLLQKTNNLISDKKLFRQMSKNAKLKSQKFSYSKFEEEFIKIINIK